MVFKCKMCGGDITPIQNTNTGKCEFCKSIMTLPNLDDEKLVNLYNRANFLRLNNEFDKAKEIYENILKIDNKQIEAHFGLLLCKYGVEYVDDPKTKKKIPTCHRTSDTSILTEADFKMIKKEAYGDALELYLEEAKKIDEIQKNILAISSNEKPYDVFICYKETDETGERTHDSVIAQDIYEKLIEQGLKVFFARITLEDKLGKEYEPYIYSALKSSKVMLVVGTDEKHFQAVWVKNEWSRYLEMMKQDKGKTLIPVYSKLDAYKLPEEFAMLQAQSMDKVGAIQDLSRGVKKIVQEYKTEDVEEIDKETILKVSQALEEARSIGEGRYEVNIVKENLPIWYYILCIGTLVFYGLERFLVSFAYDFNISLRTLENSSLFQHKVLILFELLYILLLLCYVILLFVNRKTHKIAKKIFPFLIFIFCIKPAIYLTKCLIPRDLVVIIVTYGFDFAMILVSHLIVPKWNMNTSSKSIMNKEEKDKQILKNKHLKENYKVRERNKENRCSKKIIFALILITIISYFVIMNRVWKILPYKQSNKKDSSVSQIYILGDKKIYANESTNSNVLASVRIGDYYTILNFEEVKQNDNLSFYGFLKIKTNKGIVGYLYLGEKNDYYAESVGYDYKIVCGENDIVCQNKLTYSNVRDTSVDQLEVVTETLHVREEHNRNSSSLALLKQGNIYTILDIYVEEIKESKYNENWFETNTAMYYDVVVERRNWYKIKTSNEIEGWICGNVNENTYINILSAE